MSETRPVRSSRPVHAFTLIELLVVIAIIALLISILLPAVRRARLSGMHVKSMSNVRQICNGAFAYQNDFNGFLPVVPLRPQGRGQVTEGNGTEGDLNFLCSWVYGGKNNNRYWATSYGGAYDAEAADRPLNKYLYQNPIPYEGEPGNMPPDVEERRNLDIPVFRDPSDKYSLQQQWSDTWPAMNTDADVIRYASRDPVDRQLLSSYDDVGTSYHASLKWQQQLYFSGVPWKRSFFAGMRRLRLADSFTPSRMCWMHDQYADLVVYNTNPNFRLRNGFGDFNKSSMGFLDGHAAYHTVIPGRTTESYRNDLYTFVFEDLRVPR